MTLFRLGAGFGLGAGALVCWAFAFPAKAEIIGILTEASGTAMFRPDVNGNPITYRFDAPQIDEGFSNQGFGSTASLNTTSRVGPGVVEFQNGNAAIGRRATAISRTIVEVRFKNTEDVAVRPTLVSQITPAGLGIYVTGCVDSDPRLCGSQTGDYNFGNAGTGDANGIISSASYLFRVSGNGETLYELRGSVKLVSDGINNVIVDDFGASAGILNNFQRTTPVDDIFQLGYKWDATEFEVEFPIDMILDPGASGTLTYFTEVTTTSDAFCFGEGRQACPLAYASFGDPIGRRGIGSRRAAFAAAAEGEITGLDIPTFQFALPTFERGQFNYRLAADVPEPSSLALILAGLMGVGLVRRRR